MWNPKWNVTKSSGWDPAARRAIHHGAVTPPAAHRRSPMQIQRSLQEAGMRARESHAEWERENDGRHACVGPRGVNFQHQAQNCPKWESRAHIGMEFRMKNRPRQTDTHAQTPHDQCPVRWWSILVASHVAFKLCLPLVVGGCYVLLSIYWPPWKITASTSPLFKGSL